MTNPARLIRALVLAGGFAAVSAYGSLPHGPAATPASSTAPIPVAVDPEIALLYRERGFAPLWVAGGRLPADIARLAGPDPRLGAAFAAARTGDRVALARADLLLTQALAKRIGEAHAPPSNDWMRYFDGLGPGTAPVASLLEEAAGSPSPAAQLESILRGNPALEGLRKALDTYRTRWSSLPQIAVPGGQTLRPGAAGRRVTTLRRRLGLSDGPFDADLAERLRAFQRVHGLPATGLGDRATIAALNAGALHYERLIRLNIDRARAIPADPGGRYLIVDTASARLWMVEDDRIAGTMRVIVGKSGMETPAMAGLIRYAAFNPYWNLPPDLIRQRARKVLRLGRRALAAERIEVLSDWTARARTLSPGKVDWRAVASGRRVVNMRQLPGPHNMMGRVKFMMPNELGIYLHDTPLRHHFRREDRRISSGCVRVEDAPRLARWLFEGAPPRPSGAPEQRVDLPEPIPVYIAYLTALPTREGIRFVPDRYGRDRAALARFEGGRRTT